MGRAVILEARSFCLRVLVTVLVWTEERFRGNLPGSPVVEDVEGVQHGCDDWVVRLGMGAVEVGRAG